MQLLNGVFGFIGFALSRFVLGFVLAYMLNFLSSWLEKRFRFPRWLSILSAYLLFFGAIVWMILYIIPLMYDSVQQIFVALPQYYGSIQDFVNRFFFTFSEDGRQVINDFITKASDSMLKALTGFLEFASIKSFVLSSTRIIINIIFGLMISVYGLIEKDSLLLACKRLLYSFVKKPRADAFVSFLSEANRIFSQFIVGKLLSSLIVGIISFVLYAAFGLRFSAFFAIIAAVFNLIPTSALDRRAITIVVLLCISPLHAVYALFIMLAVQTIDNFLSAPRCSEAWWASPRC
jgi:predicted PurR-regulated permease PerM